MKYIDSSFKGITRSKNYLLFNMKKQIKTTRKNLEKIETS